MRCLLIALLSWLAVAAADVNAANPAPKADPAATKLLAEARDARANWVNFPGFRADLELNDDGKISKGKVEVSAGGKVTLDLQGADEKLVNWAKRELASLAGHRLDNGADRQTPCRFVDDLANPLGRAVEPLQDELFSYYRIRDQQILEVNRTTGSGSFTITVLENRLTPEKKYLPVSFVVNNWDPKGELTSSSAHHSTWVRVGGFDLPEAVTICTAFGRSAAPAIPTRDNPPRGVLRIRQARELRFTNHELLR